MKMQIPVTNQKTKWIRSASLDADSGSQFGKIASAVPAAAATIATSVSWTKEPLRTLPANLLENRPFPLPNPFPGLGRYGSAPRGKTGDEKEERWESELGSS